MFFIFLSDINRYTAYSVVTFCFFGSSLFYCYLFPSFFSLFFFLMIRRPPRSTLSSSSAASDVYKRQPSISIMKVEGNVFIVTGGASGLGESATRLIVGKGGKVLVADMNQDKLEAICKELEPNAHGLVVDVTDEDACQEAVDTAVKVFGSLRGVVNFAGVGMAMTTISKRGPHDMGTFDFVQKVNVYGTFQMASKTAFAISQQPKQDDNGVIINVASVVAFEGQEGSAAYAVSKGAVVAMALPMARDLARFGIRVNTICPGAFATPMMARTSEKVQKSFLADVVAPKRFGDPTEMAELVVYMIEASYLNAQTIRLDGGIRVSNL
eukprot:TRINITY_DN9891_c0_g1_i3.p1 TRINITY_DN9891_c0_g1~~TRINITY_DN9891_c0_g1_i3.p1  ORF type:complete len:325 (-),score=69.79 TRINITY_DN9891_c0_g1_i3:374-1348(-)